MYAYEIYTWVLTSLFWIAPVLFALGLALVIVPTRVMHIGNSLNRWVSSNGIVEFVNAPRYVESLLYRQHRIFGAAIVIISAGTTYMLVFYASREQVLDGIGAVAAGPFYEWLFVNLYYLLVAFNLLALAMGMALFIRPSLLKRFEHWGNRWVDTEEKLASLDKVYEIPENILPGRPRLFGMFVSLAASYMMYDLGGLLF